MKRTNSFLQIISFVAVAGCGLITAQTSVYVGAPIHPVVACDSTTLRVADGVETHGKTDDVSGTKGTATSKA